MTMGKQRDKRTRQEKIKYPLHKKRGVVGPGIPCPYDVVFDKYFYEEFLVKKDIFVREMKELLDGPFRLACTHCILSRITMTRFVEDFESLDVKFSEVRCPDQAGYTSDDFNCLVGLAQSNTSVIVATGNNRLRSLLRRTTSVPIVFLEDGELYFEGTHHKREVRDNKQTEEVPADPVIARQLLVAKDANQRHESSSDKRKRKREGMDKEDGFSKNFEAKGAAFEDSSDSPKLKIKKKAKMNSKDYTPKKDITLFLKRSYNIDQPYKLLLDGSFFHYIHKHNIRREDFVTLLDCEDVQLFTTCHNLDRLESLERTAGSIEESKKCLKERCPNMNKCKNDEECVESWIKNGNPRHFLVATRRKNLITSFKMRRVPVILCTNGTLELHIVPHGTNGEDSRIHADVNQQLQAKLFVANLAWRVDIING